jgi:hypothetical protein
MRTEYLQDTSLKCSNPSSRRTRAGNLTQKVSCVCVFEFPSDLWILEVRWK